ncbi:hypothetical protein GCM10028772_29840 [Nocardioides ultimimeridianus]
MGGSAPIRQAFGTATSTPYDDTHRITVGVLILAGVTLGAASGVGALPHPPSSTSVAIDPTALRIPT